MVAQVIINSTVKTLNRIFDYNIPNEMLEKIHIGSRILVPFGNKKTLEDGFVIDIKETSEYKVKDIQDIKEDILDEKNMELAKLMANRYFCNVSDCIKLMLPPGEKTIHSENKVKDKTMNFVYLKKEIEDIESDMENKIIKSEKQVKVLNFLKENDNVMLSDIELFLDISRAVVKTLEKNGYVEIQEKKIERNPFVNKEIKKDAKLKLTKEQEHAYHEILYSIDNNEFKEYLIYGITGSGKTEIYLQLIEKVMKSNKTAIMLVPEISLTPQMIDRFIARFGQEDIAVLHSRLSIGERYDSFKKIKEGRAKIVIGARSAIFAPVQDLGLIIIDEEHDLSYKSEMNPKYNAKEISRYLAKRNNIPLVLGSATPDVTTFYKARNEDVELIKLTHRANNSNLPDVEIIDLRQELINGNRSMLSFPLYCAIKQNLENKKQTILFLNRRGFSTFVMCRECGYTLKCDHCNITMTYHKNNNELKCHYCGAAKKVVTKCPECNSNKIRYFGTGTQKLEEEIIKSFPSASNIRMDFDTITKKNSYEEIINKFKNENIDILIGTQMVVKGHHFPNVTLVGVIAADTSLYIGDYRANETTFDLLTQVSRKSRKRKYKW